MKLPDESELDRARRAARGVLGCDHLAGDALQEALIALWQQPTGPREPGPWLVRAAVLRARQLRRALERRRRHENVAAECGDHPDCDNPLHHARAHELAARLAGAIAGLPPDQRRIIDIRLREEAGYAAAARRLAVPVGTVRSRLARARAALARTLGEAVPR